MANRKKFETYRDSDVPDKIEETVATVAAQGDSEVTVVTKEKGNIKLCRITNIINGKLHIYFDNYGIQVDAPKGVTHSIGNTIKIGYSGVLGASDFKKWIVD